MARSLLSSCGRYVDRSSRRSEPPEDARLAPITPLVQVCRRDRPKASGSVRAAVARRRRVRLGGRPGRRRRDGADPRVRRGQERTGERPSGRGGEARREGAGRHGAAPERRRRGAALRRGRRSSWATLLPRAVRPTRDRHVPRSGREVAGDRTDADLAASVTGAGSPPQLACAGPRRPRRFIASHLPAASAIR